MQINVTTELHTMYYTGSRRHFVTSSSKEKAQKVFRFLFVQIYEQIEFFAKIRLFAKKSTVLMQPLFHQNSKFSRISKYN